MPVQTKRKTSVKKALSAETSATKRYRLRLREWIMFWILVALAIILIMTIFGDVNEKIEAVNGSVDVTTSSSAQEKIDDLVHQIGVANAIIADMGASNVASGRVLADYRDMDFHYAFDDGADLNTQCDRLNLNASTPTQTVVWTNEGMNLQGSLPYNFSWGNDRYAVTPFESMDTGNTDAIGIAFGPIIKIGDCIPARNASLVITPRKDLNTFLADLRKQEGVESIRQRTVNGIPVVSYYIGELAGGYYWEGFGRTYHYSLRSDTPQLTDAEAIKIIQSLRVTK